MQESMDRRRFLITAGTTAVTLALPVRTTFSQDSGIVSSSISGMPYRDATALAGDLAKRAVSSRELLEQSIARIQSLDGRLNAVVVRDFERARNAATAADAALARGERRPLLGVPITVKESFNVAGLSTTWGISEFKGWHAADDALAVARLKAAGAIVIGKTNVPARLTDWQSFNEIYGTTNNPWDTSLTPGGSSGGSAVSLAAGYVSLELGSDLAGSLRAPAHYCGIFSHKPSYGLVPGRGQTPPKAEVLPSGPSGNGLSVVGPMARSARDLALALDLLAGPDEETEGLAYRLALPKARHADLKSYRILVIDTHPTTPTADAIRTALNLLASRLSKTGAKVGRTSPLLPDLSDATRIYTRLLSAVGNAGRPAEYYEQMRTRVASLAPNDNSLAALSLRGAVASYSEWDSANAARARLSQQWRLLFKEWDAVLCPPMPTLAFAHDHNGRGGRYMLVDGKPYPYNDHMVWASLASAPGLPATVMPIDRSESGLPIGVQIIGPYLEDHTTISLAQLVEREFGGFVAPPAYR